MEIAKLLQGVQVTEWTGNCTEVTGITSDSRRVTEGCMFVCVRGNRHDGHYHAAQAVKNGASVIVCERTDMVPAGADRIVCPDTRLAEALLWNNRYDDPASGMEKIAVTGSNGKTSVAFILRHILTHSGRKPGLVTTIRTMAGGEVIPMETGGSSVADAAGAMTTPDPEYFYGAIARMRERGCDTLVYEASSHALDLHKTDAVRPDIAIFTNLTPEHLDYHGTMENYLAVKARLFTMAKLGITNADDPYGARLPEMVSGTPFLTCSMDSAKLDACDVCALRYTSHGADGISFLYCGRDAIFRVKTPLAGRYAACNVTQAVCAGLQMGLDPAAIKTALEQIEPIEGRLERVQCGRTVPFAVFLDYAHTPAALESVLLTARDMHPAKLTVVFGCGGNRDRNKRPLMGKIAGQYADKVVLTGDNAREEDPDTILNEILSGMEHPPYGVIPDRREAIFSVIREAEAGEMILLCGKGHEKYQICGRVKVPFDEAAIVREAVSCLPME